MSSVIHTYTIVRTPPHEFEGQAPYCVAIVESHGELITARISGYSDTKQVQIGDPLKELSEPDNLGATYRFL